MAERDFFPRFRVGIEPKLSESWPKAADHSARDLADLKALLIQRLQRQPARTLPPSQAAAAERIADSVKKKIEDILRLMGEHGVSHPFPFSSTREGLQSRRKEAIANDLPITLSWVDMQLQLEADGRGKLGASTLEIEIFKDIMAQHGVKL
jgi:radical SAM superfamily enzyme YgiQ (UPF0313 family)